LDISHSFWFIVGYGKLCVATAEKHCNHQNERQSESFHDWTPSLTINNRATIMPDGKGKYLSDLLKPLGFAVL